jgi:lyso-ornithine lipid O-acyltransferase
MCSVHGIKVAVKGEAPTTPVIYVANHLGYVDPLAILSVVPCAPIAKAELGEWPLVGPALSDFGVMMVRRGDPYSGALVLLQAIRSLERGVSVLAFPEGTTSEGSDVFRLHRGVFGVARIMNAPIVPVAVRHDTRDLCWVGDQTFLPHYVRTTSRSMVEVVLSFGEPIDPRSESDARRLAARARAQLRMLLTSERSSTPA